MRCKICDTIINSPVWNTQLNDWEICTTCLEIVNNVFEDPVVENSYEDEEDAEVEEDILRYLEGKPPLRETRHTILLDNIS